MHFQVHEQVLPADKLPKEFNGTAGHWDTWPQKTVENVGFRPYMYVRFFVCMHACVCNVFICVACVYMHMRACIHTYIYVYTGWQASKPRDEDAAKHTYAHTFMHTYMRMYTVDRTPEATR